MSESRWVRPRHRQVAWVLDRLDPEFLARAGCLFGGGTRLVLELGEYRESEDVDFLCAERAGWRALRGAVQSNGLGSIAPGGLPLLREVRADRYGIRTVVAAPEGPVKFEIVLEARIGLEPARVPGLPVPCLDPASCFAEKFLANADRWPDSGAAGRDVIDLAFMLTAWSRAAAADGLARAEQAYGPSVVDAAARAARHMLDDGRWRRDCVTRLSVSDSRRLLAGLRRLAD